MTVSLNLLSKVKNIVGLLIIFIFLKYVLQFKCIRVSVLYTYEKIINDY